MKELVLEGLGQYIIGGGIIVQRQIIRIVLMLTARFISFLIRFLRVYRAVSHQKEVLSVIMFCMPLVTRTIVIFPTNHHRVGQEINDETVMIPT